MCLCTPGPASAVSWELPPRYHCPVIGTCLSVSELRRIGGLCLNKDDDPGVDYEVHVAFVAAAGDRNALSLAAHKAMDRKFNGMIKRFERARDPAALLARWAECLTRGEVAAAFWAVMTHPRADDRVRRLVYEEVHMLSHQVRAAQRADLKRLATTEQALSTLRRDYDALHRRTRRQLEDQEAEARALAERLHLRESTLAEQAEHIRALEQRLAGHESGDRERELGVLEAGLGSIQTRLAETESALEQARDENAVLRRRVESESSARQDQAAEIETMERMLAERLADHAQGEGTGSDCVDCPNLDCPRRDLGGRLVLCVGGRLAGFDHQHEVVNDGPKACAGNDLARRLPPRLSGAGDQPGLFRSLPLR